MSSLGRIRRTKPSPSGNYQAGYICRCGVEKKTQYLTFTLQDNGRKLCLRLHNIVCTAFHGQRPIVNGERAQVRHLDGNRQNCAEWNLAWGTFQDNADDKILHGTSLKGRIFKPATLQLMSKAKKGRIWINNGQTSKLVQFTGEIPTGWSIGRGNTLASAI